MLGMQTNLYDEDFQYTSDDDGHDTDEEGENRNLGVNDDAGFDARGFRDDIADRMWAQYVQILLGRGER